VICTATPIPAAPVSVTVPTAVCPPVIVAGLIVTDATVTPTGMLKLTPLLATPFTVATTLPLVAPAGTVTVMLVLLQLVAVAGVPLKVTVLAPCVAPKFEPLRITEVPITPEVEFNPAICGVAAGGFTVTPKPWLALLYAAVNITGVAEATTAAGTLNVTFREPDGTVTVAGAFTAAEGLALTATATPPAGAAPVRLMVQEELAGAANDTGVQEKPLSPGWIVTVPLVVEVAIVTPAEVEEAAVLSCSTAEASEV